MEPNPSFSWKLDAADFVPSGVLPSPLSKPVLEASSEKSMKKQNRNKNTKKTEEHKFGQKSKDSLVLGLIGPGLSGKSSLTSLLSSSQSLDCDSFKLSSFESKSKKFTFFDCAGPIRSQFVPFSASDYFLLVLPVDQDIPEDYMKEITLVLKNFSFGRLVVVLSFMDRINWNNNAYSERVQTVRRGLDKYGLSDSVFIPISNAENVGKRVGKEIAPWYNGKSLMQVLETLEVPQRKSGKGLKMPIIAINDLSSNFVGKIILGSLSLQTKVVLMPMSTKVEVQSITDLSNNPLESAKTGEVVKVRLRLPEELLSQKGMVLCENQEKGVTSKQFRAEAYLFNLGSTLVSSGFQCKLLIHSAVEDAEVTEVVSVTDYQGKSKAKTTQARDSQKAIMVIKANNHLSTENYSKLNDSLGRFGLLINETVVAVGKVIELHNRVEEIASQMGL